ncbi:hypothetical protein D3C72_570860 [compost metagenome]
MRLGQACLELACIEVVATGAGFVQRVLHQPAVCRLDGVQGLAVRVRGYLGKCRGLTAGAGQDNLPGPQLHSNVTLARSSSIALRLSRRSRSLRRLRASLLNFSGLSAIAFSWGGGIHRCGLSSDPAAIDLHGFIALTSLCTGARCRTTDGERLAFGIQQVGRLRCIGGVIHMELGECGVISLGICNG